MGHWPIRLACVAVLCSLAASAGPAGPTSTASFQSLLALLLEGVRIAIFTVEEITPPSSFVAIERGNVDQMVLDRRPRSGWLRTGCEAGNEACP
jgi:hypothetical protein